MESPDSDLSPDSTDTSSADSTSADTSPAQNFQNNVPQLSADMEETTVLDHDDSVSDVSMSAETDEEEDEVNNASVIHINPSPQGLEQNTGLESAPSPAEGSRKRKFSGAAETLGEDLQNGPLQNHEDRKRIKPDEAIPIQDTSVTRLAKDKSLLPPEIWHHIFTFCPPRVLCLLLQVKKSFNAYLNPTTSREQSFDRIPNSVAQLLPPDTIWRASRRLLDLLHMPLPLSGKYELDMWKLACNSSCQFCGKKRQAPYSIPMDQWRPGPGENGVASIWSFGIRTCGSCLPKQTIKEIDLLLSSSIPSPLTAALPLVFFTNELHVLSPAALQSSQHPASIQITKRFYNPQIEEIRKEFDSVKALGSATAEEWLKGLDSRGKEHRNDAARWERWEASGGVLRMLNSRFSDTPTTHSNLATNSLPLPPAPNTKLHSPQGPMPQQQITQYSTNQAQVPMPVHTMFPTNVPPRFDTPSQNGFISYPPHAKARHERTKEEVAELKAVRRAEIERRCMLLDPPITVEVLAHMASFQAAIQIIQPLTDSAWEVLKPRLLSQREEAEQRENDRLAQNRVAQERFNERLIQDTQPRADSKDLVDKEWDDIQAPLRARIGGYADEIIRDGWHSGAKVSYDTSPLFAAEVLVYVRKRFYAELAKDEAAIRATGKEPAMDPPEGPYTRKLILENMKWVFDTKVKPHTEPYRKELFLCSACDYASKYYGFEGVIQHFAAKHTSALSYGSIVVHWRSEWPEDPPFNPDPDSIVVQPYYAAAPGTSGPYTGAAPMQQPYGYGGYPQVSVSGPMQTPNIHGYQETPGQYYGHSQFGEHYSSHQGGPYPPPPTYPETSQGYQAPQYSSAPPTADIPGYSVPPHSGNGYNDSPQGYSQSGFGGSYNTPGEGIYPSSHPGPPYSASAAEAQYPQQGYAPPGAQYGAPYAQQAASSQTQAPQRTEEYTAQLQMVARSAREIWNSIGSLKGVPGSLKVHTTIFHLLNRSRASFQDDPPLSMMVDGLSNNKDMRPVRNVNGLRCKACSLGMAGSTSGPQKKLFSFPQLVNHFYSAHEQGLPSDFIGHAPDWTKDMVELPDISQLVSVARAPGMKEEKLQLFSEALPEIFALEQPPVDSMRNGSSFQYEDITPQDEYSHLEPSQDNHEKYYTAVDSGRPSKSSSVTYDSNEYDPRHPNALPMEHRLPHKESQPGRPPERGYSGDSQPNYRLPRQEPEREVYSEYTDRSYVETRSAPPSRPIIMDDYDRVVVHEAPVYLERPIHYRDSGEVEYRVRPDPHHGAYDEPDQVSAGRNYRLVNSKSYESNKHGIPPTAVPMYPPGEEYPRPVDDTAAQTSHILDVVAKISHQAQQARNKIPVEEEPIDAGSEDGELPTERGSKPEIRRVQPTDEAGTAADRFLDGFHPGSINGAIESSQDVERRQQDELRAKWEAENPEGARRLLHQLTDPQQRRREEYEQDGRVLAGSRRLVDQPVEEIPHSGYIIRERAPQSRYSGVFAYGDRYASSIPEQSVRDRSPELVDRRYKLNNVIYRDERQGSHGTHRTPSRYARYESVRLENDRTRSRSPVYVKPTPLTTHYRERSPAAHPLRQEQIYHTRTPPPAAEGIAIERHPRPEYYPSYVDEPRPREPQYTEAFEYVRVSDPQGDYMIRRPIRRERQPIYTTYEDEVYTRQPVYETRAPISSRPEPVVYDEYDPRRPAPGAADPVRQVRYQ